MEDDIIRKVAQDVLLFILSKNDVIKKEQIQELPFIPDITAEMMENLQLIVWMESDNNSIKWESFFKNHFERMSSSPRLFAIYVTYACYLVNKSVEDAYASFIRTLAIVTQFGLYCWHENRKSFINLCVELFCTRFGKDLRKQFTKQGGWKNFNAFIESQKDFAEHKEILEDDPFNDCFKAFLREFKGNDFYIVSGISLKTVKRNQVENRKDVITFADSVSPKLERLSNLTLDELLTNFSTINTKLSKLYGQQIGKVASQQNVESEKSHSQDMSIKPSENSLETHSSKENLQSIPTLLKAGDSNNVSLQDIAAPASNLDPPVPGFSRAKTVLQAMLKEIDNVSQLLMFMFESDEKERKQTEINAKVKS